MNRFFAKTKFRDASFVEPAPSANVDETPVPKLSARKTRKWKKERPEPKPELDLSTVLPSADNFRTSLIMPNLSARFSMLKEQDDPNSRLGKARDDSVLQSLRQSRLNNLTFSTVSDRAEDSFLKNPIRPPFAFEEHDSISSADGYGTDDDSTYTGSIMSRARRGEGNVLFGGRQKIYRIPTSGTGSTKSLGGDGRPMAGRALYEDDVSSSTFQKYRQEKRMQRGFERDELDLKTELEQSGCSSSLGDYNKKRDTVSSTTSASAPSVAASTAATSVDSQGVRPSSPAGRAPSLERSNTKTRRLYENGLDQHMCEQQSSALTRLNSIQRQRNPGSKITAQFVSQARSVSDFSDHHNRSTSPTPNISSPPFSANNDKPTTFSSIRQTRSSGSSPTLPPSQSPPLSSPIKETGEVNALALSIEPNDYGKATAMGTFNRPKRFDEQQYLQRQMHMQEGKEAPSSTKPSPPTATKSELQKPEHKFTLSTPKVRQRSETTVSSNRNVSSAFQFFQNAVNRMQADRANADRKPSHNDAYGTFFSHITGSDSEDEERDSQANQTSSRTYPPSSPQPESNLKVATPPTIVEHPAMPSPSLPEPEISDGADAQEPPETLNTPSHTMERTTSGLSGLVRQHLRHTSTQSSVVDPPSPVHWSQDPDHLSALADVLPLPSVSFRPSASPNQEWQTSDREASGDEPLWQHQLRKGHHREASSETQAEREAFANELAQRQKAIQEALKSKVDSGSRSTSPSLGSVSAKPLFDNALRPFARLRSKSSRDNRSPSPDTPASRTLKMSAFGKNSANASSASLVTNDERLDADGLRGREASKQSQDPSRSSALNRAQSRLQNSDYSVYSVNPQIDQQSERGNSNKSGEEEVLTHRQSSHSSAQGHSSAESSSAQSRSPRMRYLDDSKTGTVQGTFSIDRHAYPSDAISSQSQASMLSDDSSLSQSPVRRSDSQSSEKGYFDSKAASLHPTQTNVSSSMDFPRPSPNTPYSANSTPPLSSASRPTTQSSGMNGIHVQQPAWQSMQRRKRSVHKSDISEPVFLSSTCNVDVVSLPPGASLKNGQDESRQNPPVPPANPRRRATFGKAHKTDNLEILSSRVYTPEPKRTVSMKG